LADVCRVPLPGAQQICAHRAWALALGPEHVAVNGEGLFVPKQSHEIGRPLLALEAIISDRPPPGGRARRWAATRSIWRRSSISSAGSAVRGGAVLAALVGDSDQIIVRQFASRGQVFGAWRPSEGPLDSRRQE
jgi:hypothetical protein